MIFMYGHYIIYRLHAWGVERAALRKARFLMRVCVF